MHPKMIVISCFLYSISLFAFSQGKSGYYINWNMNHAETEVQPSIAISEKEVSIINCYQVDFDENNKLKSVKYYFSGKPSNYGNYGAFELVREYHKTYFVEQYKDVNGNTLPIGRALLKESFI